MNPFPDRKPLIGVIHLAPLPGAPRFQGAFADILTATARDAETLAQAGFDGAMVENFGDTPFYRKHVPAETIAAMAVLADVARRASGLPLGVNVLRNDGIAAVAIAVATQARFVRINVLVGARVADQGVVQGDAARVQRLRTSLGAASTVRIAADVDVKHSVAFAPMRIDDEAREAVERAGADVVIVSGPRTGDPAERDMLLAVKSAVEAPVWLGSGVRRETLRMWLDVADGVLVGTALRRGGRPGGPIDLDEARAFVGARN